MPVSLSLGSHHARTPRGGPQSTQRDRCGVDGEKPLNENRMGIILRLSGLAVTLSLECASAVWAQTDEIQVYDPQISSPGVFNLTWHNNFISGGSRTPNFPGAIGPDKSLNGVTEWAYGVAPWFEAGLYFPLYSITRGNSFLYNGFKLRTLLVSPDAANRDVFYGVNFEF